MKALKVISGKLDLVLRSLEARLKLWSLCNVPQAIPKQYFSAFLSPAFGSAIAIVEI